MIRVLVVEDSSTVRDLLVWICQRDSELQVVGAARDGLEGVRLAARLRPDVIIMDIHMPGMDGFQASRQIMQQTPTPIVVVSATVGAQSIETSFNALQAGALAVVPKPVGPTSPSFTSACDELVTTVKLMSEVKVVRRWDERTLQSLPVVSSGKGSGLRVAAVAIAASTGGPGALHRVLSALPSDFAVPVLVVQHITPGFGQGLVEWLNRTTPLEVNTARQGEPLLPGRVLIAPDNRHLSVRPSGHVLLHANGNGICPSADPLFASMAKAFGRKALGVVMTGMGRDGVEGLKQLKAARGTILAQDEASCVVFGMPKEAIAAGVVDRVVPLERMAATIMELI